MKREYLKKLGLFSCFFFSNIVSHGVTVGGQRGRIAKLIVCVFFGVFSGDLGFSYSHPHQDLPSLLKCFLSVVVPLQ